MNTLYVILPIIFLFATIVILLSTNLVYSIRSYRDLRRIQRLPENVEKETYIILGIVAALLTATLISVWYGINQYSALITGVSSVPKLSDALSSLLSNKNVSNAISKYLS